jgi:hypothetical protein
LHRSFNMKANTSDQEAKLAAIIAASDSDAEYVALIPELEGDLGIERCTFVIISRSDYQRIRDKHLRP